MITLISVVLCAMGLFWFIVLNVFLFGRVMDRMEDGARARAKELIEEKFPSGPTTMSNDGKNIVINAKWLLGQSPDRMKYLIEHEQMYLRQAGLPKLKQSAQEWFKEQDRQRGLEDAATQLKEYYDVD
jgi:hypothetical protein